MDRNSAIGLTLIAALLFVYFTWFAQSPEPPAPQKDVPQPSGNTVQEPAAAEDLPPDSTLAAEWGDLAGAMRGQDAVEKIETKDLKITFSSKGGVIRELELANYQTYRQQPLRLITPANNSFSLKGKYGGRELDLYQLYYTSSRTTRGDTTVISFKANTGNGTSITQEYAIPAEGFEIRYSISSSGFSDRLSNEPLAFEWNNAIKLTEKDLEDTRNNTTINYFQPAEGFDKLSETGAEAETLNTPVSWVSIKEKFFVSALISQSVTFPSATVETRFNPADTSVVKHAQVKLQFPREILAAGKQDLKFYFGPNDYQIIGKVAEGFARNVYLGWPPVYWINKFVIFPVFHFLTQVMSNYGLIIIVLVILLKLVLFPLSYKSYLSMAKMKVLKPELDEIKERVGEDMTKVQQEQMKLYQQVGVNPISGCIPVLLQMPILFAMFYLFPASIELRQQPFLWAEDLSTYDSLIHFSYTIPFLGNHISIFTVLMTVTTLVYTWQNNQISSVQGPMKSLSYIMPVIFFFILNKFSAGLTFYYFISTLVTIGQQAIIKRFVDEDKIKAIMEENRKKNQATGGKKSKFMSRLEEAMKASEETRKKAEEERKKRKDNKK